MEDSPKEDLNIQDLPDDVIIEIFSYFNVHVLTKTVSPVCKSWRVLSKDATLWRDFQFKWNENLIPQTRRELERCTQLRTLIIDASIGGCIASCNMDETFSFPTLKYLTIQFAVVDQALLADFNTRFPHLESLKLYKCFVEVEFQQAFVDMLSNLSTLKSLDLYLKRMSELLNDAFLNRVAENFTNLEKIDLQNSKTLSTHCIGNLVHLRGDRLTTVKLQNSLISDEAVAFFPLCPNLKSLGLRCTADITNVAFDVLRELKLQCLELNCWTRLNHNISPETLLSFFQSDNRLPMWRLALCGFVNLSDDTLREVVTHCPNLRHLFVGATDLVTNEGVVFCGNFLPNLTYINIQECRHVTPDIRAAIPLRVEIKFTGVNV